MPHPNPDFELVIGSRHVSSWSLRPWLLMRELGIPFEERLLDLAAPDWQAQVRPWSPSGRVPVLRIYGQPVWESLAIMETLAEYFPDRGVWPVGFAARQRARALASEVHAGFANVRREFSLDLRGVEPVQPSAAAQAELDRLFDAWRSARAEFGGSGGPFLFGAFCAADAMFAPFALRLQGYRVPVPADVAAYYQALLALPGVQEWVRLAEQDLTEPASATPA